MPDPDFDTVLRAAQSAPAWAVALLYQEHHPRLLRYLRAQAPQDCADIASDTWLDAARNLRTFTGDTDAFAGWLFTIARRRLIDHRRARGRRPVDPAPLEAFDRLTAPSAEADAIACALGDDAVREILALLPEDQAEVVLLRVVGGLDAEAVAQITGRRAGAVRVLQHRALKRLAKHLAATRNAGEGDSDGTQRDAQAPSPPR